MNHTEIYQQILQKIAQTQKILLVLHRDPDGDTIGAGLAMAHYFESIGKNFTLFCADEPCEKYLFLPSARQLLTNCHTQLANLETFDVIIALDTSDIVRTGINHQRSYQHCLINIDHHPTNELYGDLNLVDPHASSTCEIVYHLLRQADGINKEAATCLMAGLISDTSGFTNLATTASAITTASWLMANGVNIKQMIKKMISQQPIDTLKLWGRAFERLYATNYGLTVTLITLSDLKELRVDLEAAEGVANFLNHLDKNVSSRVILVLTEQDDGSIKGSLRTTHPLIDVSKLAKLLGGGGHKKAAGFEVPGSLALINKKYVKQ